MMKHLKYNQWIYLYRSFVWSDNMIEWYSDIWLNFHKNCLITIKFSQWNNIRKRMLKKLEESVLWFFSNTNETWSTYNKSIPDSGMFTHWDILCQHLVEVAQSKIHTHYCHHLILRTVHSCSSVNIYMINYSIHHDLCYNNPIWHSIFNF